MRIQCQNRVFPLGIAVCSTLLIVNPNAGIVGLPEVLTGVRVAIVILLCYAAANRGGLSRIARCVTTMPAVAFTICILVVASLASFVSFLFSSANTGDTPLVYVVSWLMILLSFVLLLGMGISAKPKCLVTLWTIAAFLVIAVVALDFIGHFRGFPESTYRAREYMNQALPGGINRFFNALFALLVIPAASLLRVIRVSRFAYLLSGLTVCASLTFGMLSGSRQFLGACLLLVLILLVAGQIRTWRPHGLHRKKLLPAFAGIGTLVVLVLLLVTVLPDETLSSVADRYIGATAEQWKYGSDRTSVYADAWHLIEEHPVLGVGPGGYFAHTGRYVDSGILGLAVEHGLIVTIGLLGLAGTVLFLGFRSALRTPGLPGALSITFLSGSLITLLWLNTFNELFRDYVIWAQLALAFSSIARARLVAQDL